MQLTVLIVSLLTLVASEKIVFFTFPHANSQVIFNNRLAAALADGGHKVAIVNPLINPNVNLDVDHPGVKEFRTTNNYNPDFFDRFSTMEHKYVFESVTIAEGLQFVKSFNDLMMSTCENLLSDHDLVEKLRSEKFDMAVHHHVDFCGMALIQHLGIKKWMYATSTPPFASILNGAGIPVEWSYLPGILSASSNHMTFGERFKNYLTEVFYKFYARGALASSQTEVARKNLGENITNLGQFARTASLLLLNSDPIVEYPVPVTKKVVFIGGIGAKTTKALAEPFVSFLNKSEKVVLVSFGSVVTASGMPTQWKDAFLKLFRTNPAINFIWKFEGEVDVPDNVLRSTWIPQNDLLDNTKVAAFITHSGYNSFMETLNHGVPVILVPLFGDQFRNARLAEYRGFGVKVDKNEISAEKLSTALNTVFEPSYTENARGLQKVIQTKPVAVENELLYMVDLVLHTNVSLNMPELNIVQLYSLDCLLIILSSIALLPFLIWQLSKCYYWSCCTMAYKEKVKLQ